MSEVQHELLSSADALQVGVVIDTPPAFAVGMVGQGRLVAVGIEPPREPPMRNARAIGVGQDQSLVELGEHSPSWDFALFIVTAQFELR